MSTALENLAAGDTLIMHGGEYTEQIDLRKPGVGRSDAPITVRAADGERPVLVGLLRLHDLEYWTIEGLNVTWDPTRNTKSQHMVKIDGGHDWVYANAEIWGAQSYAAILVAGTPRNFELSSLYIHDTGTANDLNQDHLIYLNCGTGGGVVERNLLVGSPNGRAIKIGPESSDGKWVGNVLIRHNTMVDNQGPSNVQLSWRATDVTVENNLMVGSLENRTNITVFELTGGGNVARNNAGWDAAGVVQEDVNLTDGGGNIIADPAFDTDGSYRPTNPLLRIYGHLATE